MIVPGGKRSCVRSMPAPGRGRRRRWARRRTALLAAAALAVASAALAAPPRVALVLDGSGSMWGRIEGTEKIVIAREVLGEVLAELPAGTQVGLAAYGHRREGACDDIEILLPVGEHSREELEKVIHGVQPRGKTPITAALQLVADQLATAGQGPAHLVLVSDGEETCGGDPCALVRSLREQGIQLTFHVVGFDVKAEEREQLACVAREGGGIYADASTAGELTAALSEIRATVVEQPPTDEGPPSEFVSLETGWRVHQYELGGGSQRDRAAYSFSDGGRVAVQTNNPMASVYYRIEPLPEGVEVTGRFAVETRQDDDLIGFVFGWQDPQHYYLFDWKKGHQPSGACGVAKKGASLKLMATDEAPPSEGDLFQCRDFWNSEGTERVTPLVGPEANPAGWKHDTSYVFRLVFRPGDILIEVLEGDEVVVSITSNDATYRSGSFGFFNYSQPQVRYDSFRFELLDSAAVPP